MSNLRNTTIVGRLGQNPEVRTTSTGKEVAGFSIAVNQYNPETKTEETVWVDCSAWDRNKDYVLKHLSKGEMVWATGILTQYTNSAGVTKDQLNVKATGFAGNFLNAEADDEDVF